MSAEFSLLQHLGVSVECGLAPAEQRSGAAKTPPRDTLRVWAPIRHPPSNKNVSVDQVSGVRDRKRKGPQKSYADPTGEVLLRKEYGAEVQYVVYNSKVPSIYGINQQLAERKRAERARSSSATALETYELEFGQGEALREEARRHILRGLQLCNQEQASRKKEEERRDRERRIALEKAHLRYLDAEAARTEEEARLHRAHQEEVLRKAAAQAAAAKKHAAETSKNVDDICVWAGADEDEQRRRASQRRTRECAEANQRMAERQRAERNASEAAERERSRVERAEVERQAREARTREAAKQQRAAEALRREQEAERERRLVTSAAGRRASPAPVGSLFDFAEQRESQEALRAQQRLREDMAINARLAEARRTQAREERERERREAARVADANFADFQREVAQSRLRRMQERKELRDAAEVAAAVASEREKQNALVDRSQPDDSLLFWARDDSLLAGEAKAEAQRRYRDEVRREAERRHAERAREEREERAWERALVECDNEAAKEAAARERREACEKTAQLRRTLEVQMAAKKTLQQQECSHSQRGEPLRVPGPEVKSLYRCPVTGELLPASAYDFGIHKSR
ncbi:hypothetical protein ABL78_4579 [Leptomonas seymouri]|uniref:Uncharacterized protein n=1 Tax=Leptomonas seymouri TaxID=5684 RepID=A0A0N1IK43_LEPSE|nr:hypothetical protein ABL78_4579 [Leptomonas seymouri]|eukprot:KPI86353.1 hypothetical protein ABL78_4579 [Leptomonas seymouri]